VLQHENEASVHLRGRKSRSLF